jgi:2-polyprenyl-3-methyl-5-hydroxy-6-metoxy-1,4-benzoquinol methylase
MREIHEKIDLSRWLGEVYSCNETSRVWSRPNYGGISYSDGDSTEDKILDILKNAQDLSVLSSELRQHCTDWPSLYHLSTSRANILRPRQQSLTGDILEIGAGCGAITRFLGECGANVLALEGSLRRARITRERTRDLKNVAVLAERFADFQVEMKFDVVTLIGVLEYANLFTEASNPPLAMLKKVRKLLKPDGILMIAIENQLGLKYFSGANEDHLGQPMFGIEDRYTSKTARTFGRLDLNKLLDDAGFPVCEFMACFPDYKIPSSIITHSGLNNSKFDAAALASQSVAKDHLKPEYLCFAPELVWPTIVNNGLGLDLANSFLVSAGTTGNAKTPTDVLAYHYSADRLKKFTKETIFKQGAAGEIFASFNSLLTDAPPMSASVEFDRSLLKFEVPQRVQYCHGRPLFTGFFRLLSNAGWTHEALKALLKDYLDTLLKIGGVSSKLSSETQINGRMIDCIPSNLISKQDGVIEFVDTEWVLAGEIPVRRVLFRALLNMTFMPSNFTPDELEKQYSYGEFFKLCFKLLGFDLDDSTLMELFSEELKLQKAISGYSPSPEQIEKLLVAPLPNKKYYSIIPAYRRQVERLSGENARLVLEIESYNVRNADLLKELTSIKQSRKWRFILRLSEITPRFVKRFFRWILS